MPKVNFKLDSRDQLSCFKCMAMVATHTIRDNAFASHRTRFWHATIRNSSIN